MAGEDKHLEYDIDEPDEENYQNNYLPFIERLRAILTVTQSHTIGVLLPQLPASQISNESLLYLRLTSGDHSIIAVLQQSNLYVRGYSRDGGNTYWALSDSTTMIPRSQSLEFDGNYDHIERVAGGDATRERLTPGYELLNDAIISLAGTENPHTRQSIAARGLLILIVMIAEAARIRLISDYISLYWWIPQPIPRNVVISLVNTWRTFSGAVQNSDSDVPPPHHSPLLPSTPLPNDANINTIRQAMAVFGLLIYYGRPGGPRQKREVSQSSYARTLVCIEYIKINNIDGENPGDLYGTVVVTDCWGQHTVYDRSRADSESKRPGEYATLTGPTSDISGADAFTISASLMDRDSASPDDQVAQGEITWDPRFQNSYYDKTVETIIRGQNGNVSVGYSVITNALSATINVVMINGDGENPADVYGTIKAIIPLGGSSSTTVSLFDKSSSEYQSVHPGSSIPLTRYVIPAPVNSNLTIEASLWDHDTMSSDDQIAEGSVKIMPIVTTGPAKPMKITGKYGQVEVSVVFK